MDARESTCKVADILLNHPRIVMSQSCELLAYPTSRLPPASQAVHLHPMWQRENVRLAIIYPPSFL